MGDYRDVGAAWERTSAGGKRYMNIVVKDADGNQIKYVAFQNDKKGVENRPDWKIYPDTPKGESGGGSEAPF